MKVLPLCATKVYEICDAGNRAKLLLVAILLSAPALFIYTSKCTWLPVADVLHDRAKCGKKSCPIFTICYA